MFPNNKTKPTSSSSVQAAASKQEDMKTVGRTTRGMKAKAQKAAAEEQANAQTSEDANTNAADISHSTDKSASKSGPKARKQASETAQAKQASDNARHTTHKAKATSATTKSGTTSVLGKRKSSSSEDSSPQQNDNSNKAPRESVLTGKSDKDSDEEKEIDPTSHLVTQYFSNCKVRVNSNGKPEKLQKHIHDEVDDWLKSERKKPFQWATQVNSVPNANMLDDFKDMGFSSTTAGDMVKFKEPLRVDGTMQRPSAGYGKHVEGTGEVLEKRTRKPSTRGKKYEALVIFEDQAWILFDPLKGYPETHGQPPLCITKWETYKPGNPRILFQNPKSKSVRSQATPAALQNCTVEYTESGPKIDGWVPIAPKVPKLPPPEPEPEPDRPLLGRGAKRNASRVTSSEANKSSPASKAPAAPPAPAKKRKSDEISVAAEAEPSPAPQEAAAETPPATKKIKKESSTPPEPKVLPPRALKGKRTSLPAAAEEQQPAASESVAGEGKQKRKRRPGRPKITPARVENSSSE